MNIELDGKYKIAANSGILADNALLTSETQTPNRGLYHLRTTYHTQAPIPIVEHSLMKIHQNGVGLRSPGHGW